MRKIGFQHSKVAELRKEIQISGSGALKSKMLLVRIIENNKIDAYLRSGQVK